MTPVEFLEQWQDFNESPNFVRYPQRVMASFGVTEPDQLFLMEAAVPDGEERGRARRTTGYVARDRSRQRLGKDHQITAYFSEEYAVICPCFRMRREQSIGDRSRAVHLTVGRSEPQSTTSR